MPVDVSSTSCDYGAPVSADDPTPTRPLPPVAPSPHRRGPRFTFRPVDGLIVLLIALLGAGVGLGAYFAGRALSKGATTPNSSATTAAIPPASTTIAPPTTAPAATAAPTTNASPTTVVEEYFAAINGKDYQEAWALGGDHFGGSYTAFVQGFSTTAHVDLTSVSSQGNTVSVAFVATQDSGAQLTYQGTYTVSSGIIMSADVQQT
jgi:hypothetical protein